MGAWKHISHRFQLRHMCDPRQFAKSLACDAWVRGSRSGKCPAAHFGHREPLAEEHWRRTSVMASAPGTVWSRQASWRHLLGTRLPGHTLVTPGFLQKSTGGTFWAPGFEGTLWSRRASCRRARSAPFGHELLKPDKTTRDQSVPPQEPKRCFRVTAPRPLHELVQNSLKRDQSVPPQEAKRL